MILVEIAAKLAAAVVLFFALLGGLSAVAHALFSSLGGPLVCVRCGRVARSRECPCAIGRKAAGQ